MSDIDLLIVGQVDLTRLRQRLREAERELGREINETVYSDDEFAQRLRDGDPLLQRIMAAPRIHLIGGNDDAH